MLLLGLLYSMIYCECVALNARNAQIALRAVPLIAHNASGRYK